ncbi:MAG: ABC transporter permease [Caldilineaceae bacterium]
MMSQTTTATNPTQSFIRLERRLEQPLWLQILSPLILLVVALLFGAVLLRMVDANPWTVYRRMAELAFGDAYGWSDTTLKATPLILAGLGVSLAFRMRLWNIGAEGQLFIGAWFATGVALQLLPESTPQPLMLGAMALAGFVGGALWGAIPGLLKARLNVNEIITSLMLNYVAIFWNNYFIYGPWSQRGFGLSPQFPRAAWLPRFTDYAEQFPFLRGLTAHFGIFLALILAIVLWWALRQTKWGFEIRVLGDNPRAAHYAGINIVRNTVLIMMLSGGLAGLAGMSEVAGVVHRLQERFSPGYGFTAIIVAWLAKLNPLAIVLVAYLFAGLLVGGDAIQPAGIAQMLQGVILFVMVGGEMVLQYRVRVGRG